ncbi:MAG: ABC transporter ATP-binding protein [Steroidobacteraceae bacterium]
MIELVARTLTVERSGRRILDEVSLEARGGELIAVIGANGAGKSTLLSVLAGLLAPTRGAVSLGGTPLAAFKRTELARRRAYLPQNPRCEWPISVERVVALGLTPILPALGGLPETFRPRIDAALELCDLLGKRLQPATTLSGGELMRAMLARALVGDPDVLIVDEPTSGLDPRHALDAAVRLRALADAGKLVIAAIHDLTLVARYATRVVALHLGALAADGAVAKVLTPELLHTLFEIDACVVSTPGGAYVDYLAGAAGAQAPGRSREPATPDHPRLK